MKTKYILGIDPGYTMTGMVLYTDGSDEILEWAVHSCPKSVYSDLQRAIALSDAVVNTAARWLEKHYDGEVDACVELPILKKGRSANVVAFGKQMRLVQEIETGLYFRLPAVGPRAAHLTEVMPTESKRIATGSGTASKERVIHASPFQTWEEAASRDVLEALADAWAHGQAAYGVGGNRYDLSNMLVAKVVSNEKRA